MTTNQKTDQTDDKRAELIANWRAECERWRCELLDQNKNLMRLGNEFIRLVEGLLELEEP